MLEGLKTWAHNTTTKFSNNRVVSGSREFLNSNTLAAKFVF